MGYTHYTTPVNTTPVYEPLPLEAIMQGNKAVYDRGEKNVQKIQGLIDSAYSLPSLQGKDTEVKNKIIQSYMDNISQLAKGNLTDPKTAAQIESYISRVTRDPQIAGIVERATTAATIMKEKKDAELKGQKYFNKGLFDVNRYINDGVFLADKRFSNDGGIAPDEAENLKKTKEIVREKVRTYNQNGHNITEKEVNEREARDIYKQVAESNPNYKKYYETMWNEQMIDSTPEEIYDTYISPLYNATIENIYLTGQKLSDSKLTPIEKADLMSKRQSAIEKKEQLERLRNNPNSQEQIKDYAFSQYIDDLANNAADALSGIVDIKKEVDQYSLSNQKYEQDLKQTQAKDLSLGASLNGWSLQETLRDPSKIQKALADSQQAKLAEFSAKEGIKLSNKIAAKENAVKGGFKFTDSDTITYVDESGDSKTLQYGTFKEEIKKAPPNTAQRMISAALNQKNATDASWIPLTSEQVKVTGVGDRRKIKINSVYGWGGEQIPIDDVIDISNFTKSSEETSTPNKGNTGQIELPDGTKVNAIILSNPSDTSKLNKGEYAIVNGQPFLKE